MSVKERIKWFKLVRDIPYSIAVGSEQDFSCSTKSEILAKLLGLKWRFRICQFRWEDSRLPKKMLTLPHDDPEYHQFLEVSIPETKKWVVVDSTWDSGLKKIFPVADWDGLGDTILAVKAIKTYSPEESDELLKNYSSSKMKKWLKRNGDFVKMLNTYFRDVRI